MVYTGCGCTTLITTNNIYDNTTPPPTPLPSSTPTPTPTKTTTPPPASPSPTRTPTLTPTATSCECYNYTITNTDDESVLTYQAILCIDGCLSLPATYNINPSQSLEICACNNSVSTTDVGVIITKGGCCGTTPTPTPTPTKTPTPSSTPSCNCVEYEFQNNTAFSTNVNYTDCDGTPIEASVPGDSFIVDCACEGSVEDNPSIILTNLGECIE